MYTADHACSSAAAFAVDLFGVDLDAVVSIERGQIALYRQPGTSPRPGPKSTASTYTGTRQHASSTPTKGARLPQPGQGLNQPALLTFRRMMVRQPNDRRTVEAFRGKLLEASARMGGVFVHYDPDEGVWLMKLDSWI